MNNYNPDFKKLIIATLSAVCASVVIFAWYRDWIIISFPTHTSMEHSNHAPANKKKVALFFIKKNNAQIKETCEYKEILWADDDARNALALVQAWAVLIDEENLLQKKITIQAVTLAPQTHELIISFDRKPFKKQDAASKKYLFLMTLLKTIREALPSINSVRFLVDHTPFNDDDIDTSKPWPLSFASWSEGDVNAISPYEKKSVTSIVIDPAGDTHHTGRAIDGVFERSLAMRCAQELKKYIEERFPNIKIYLTRSVGDAIEPLHSATFSNRLGAHLYLSLRCYQEINTPRISLITFAYEQPQTVATKHSNLSLQPLHTAYMQNFHATQSCVKSLHTALPQKNTYIVDQPCSFPYQPLLGINTVALGIELGLTKKDDWQLLIRAIAQGLDKLLH